MQSEDDEKTILPGKEPRPHREMDVTADSTSHSPIPGEQTAMDSRSWGGSALDGSSNAKAISTGSRYKILRPLGEGGFGIVYLADQSEPVRRKVALKVLKMAFASPATLARFAAEQQALAIMDHPGLAKVFDAGTTPDGQPYFAMEYAPGEPLAAFCDHRRVDLRARLTLLAQICDAIQHAHMKGLVHRDLKPGNILVAETDEGYRAKVIDFGIAKVVSASAGENPHETQFGQFVGTPVYMSPEQAEGGSIDIDTRSDIYAMGVILYELLVGTTPIESETLRKSGIAHLHRTILETDPLRPSARLEKMDATERTSVCAARHTEFAPLVRHLKRDLDWITMRCLEKDRARRYESASALAADIRRYLNGEAVLAGPPGNAYRIDKFVRRNRIAVGVAASATLGLMAFGTSVWFLWRDAVVQQRRAEQTLDVFISTLKSSDVSGSQSGTTVTVRDLLESVEVAATEKMKEDPNILNELRETIGPVFTSLTDYDAAARNMLPAVDYRRALAADGDETEQLALAEALHEYGRALFFLKRFPESRAAYEEALEIRQTHLPNNDGRCAQTLLHLSAVYLDLKELELSDKAGDAALAAYRRSPDEEHERLASALFSRATALRKSKRFDDSRTLANECATVIIKNRGATDWRLGRILSLLADLEVVSGRFDLAVTHQRRAVDLLLPRLGPSHPTLTEARHKLALFLTAEATGEPTPSPTAVIKDRTHLAEAIKHIRDAIDGRRQFGSAPIELARSLALLSILAQISGDAPSAIAAENQIINMLQERAPHAAEQLKTAQDRLLALQPLTSPAIP